VPIVAVKTRSPRAADQLVLADALQAIDVRHGDGAVYQFVHHLRQAGGIAVVYEVLRRHPAHGLDGSALSFREFAFSAFMWRLGLSFSDPPRECDLEINRY